MGLFGKKRIPVVLITGYLGSGKTTLLNNLLCQESRKVAVVVNDMGEVNVDAKLIKNEGAKTLDTRMVELSNGCICCTLRDEFMKEVEGLATVKGLEGIFVEASGISDPASIAEAFLSYEEMNSKATFFLSSIVTVVDADRIYSEFLTDLEEDRDKEGDPDIINLVVDQIEFCNIVILNKCDLLETDEILRVKDAIRKLQPDAELMQAIKGKVSAERILDGKKFDYQTAMNSSIIQKVLARNEAGETCDDEYGITSFVFEEKRPFDRDRFMKFLSEDFPETIIRSKGYIWFADDPIHVQLVESAGRNAAVTEMSNWVAAFDEKDKEEVFQYYPEVKEAWDETYGDRMNQVVFIGRDYDKGKIREILSSCIADQ
ncbi:MAG: GTP-binding protein [Lachnospiraceae bacterium]|nr:GTP-binding protein [Lachnospiraceae bacterium]